ncbi:YfdX family protein [Sulfuriferula sp. GW1]|uniref:YfdX family protein n=1 Tax=Sulfuriferula sp. GW1 TaxID=3345111 RepID=UPI0039AF6CE9
MRTFSCHPLIASLLLGSVLTRAWGAEAPVVQQVSVVPSPALSIAQQQQLSDTAVKVLHQITAAREDIALRNAVSAHQALDNAGNLLTSLQTSLPVTRVSAHVWNAQKHLEYDSSARVQPDLIPIHADLHTLRDFIPAQQNPAQTRSHPQQSLKQPGTNELHATDATLIYAEADLPLAHTRQAVDTARHALDQQNWQRADHALKNAEDGVVFMSVSVNRPFAAGRQSLLQTTRLLAAGETAKARLELQRARSYLQRAAQTTDMVARDDANQLLQDADRLDAHIRNDDANLVNDAQTLWYRTAALAERSHAYLGNEWAIVMHDQPVKSRLIEARLALRDAAIDQFTAHQPAAAGKALARAQSYLAQAMQIARTDNQPQIGIHGVQQHVARLATEAPAQRSPDQYRQLAGELGVLISQS